MRQISAALLIQVGSIQGFSLGVLCLKASLSSSYRHCCLQPCLCRYVHMRGGQGCCAALLLCAAAPAAFANVLRSPMCLFTLPITHCNAQMQSLKKPAPACLQPLCVAPLTLMTARTWLLVNSVTLIVLRVLTASSPPHALLMAPSMSLAAVRSGKVSQHTGRLSRCTYLGSSTQWNPPHAGVP